MYINQEIQVKWNNAISNQSNSKNGVKQLDGRCLSPSLFSVYLNKLIAILRTSNVGCRYGIQYMGAYCYADDLSLLSPSFTGLMLRLCELYAMDHNIIFNAKKESVIVFRF